MSLVLDFVSVVKYVNTTSLFTQMWYVYITESAAFKISYACVVISNLNFISPALDKHPLYCDL